MKIGGKPTDLHRVRKCGITSKNPQNSAEIYPIWGEFLTSESHPRILRRPLLGWGFRLWWQGVCEGLGLAVLVLGSWGGLNLLLEAVKVLG